MTEDFDRFVDELQGSILEQARRIYTKQVIEHWMYPRNLDGMPAPNGFAEYTGPCGDAMKIYLHIRDDRIIEATFLTDGCGPTIACGSIVTELVKGKDIFKARNINNDTVLKTAGGLPEADQHCVLLAATALQKALADYEPR